MKEQIKDITFYQKIKISIGYQLHLIPLAYMVMIHKKDWIFLERYESGVSISTIDEMEKLFDGFDLCATNTSVSKTINGNYCGILRLFLMSQ